MSKQDNILKEAMEMLGEDQSGPIEYVIHEEDAGKMIKQEWSKEVPVEDGWYWVRSSDKYAPDIYLFEDGKFWGAGCPHHLSLRGFESIGPIAPPK